MGSSLYSQGEQEASPRYRSLPHAACSSRPVTGQRRPWNTAAVSSARLCRESGLKGAPKLARVWRKITTTPGLSGKAARPVSGRTRHTGSGWQSAAGGQDSLG
ncbi:hypothetical protein OL397_004522 [Salmonella enterica]|nr:hypothetical protein [Salmonella enterica]